MTKKLTKIQNQFVEAIYNEKDAAILREIKTDGIPKEQLLEIYRDGVYATLLNVLKLTYPKVYGFLSEKKFKDLACEFTSKNRSKSGNLDEYGEEFGDFLLAKNEDFLAELAKMEWQIQASYLAGDGGVFDLPALQKLAPEELCEVRFELHPAVFIETSHYNLLSKRKLTKKNKNPVYFVIYRHENEVEVEKIPKSEFNFLTGAKKGLTFYEICDKYEVDIQFCLQKYISNNVLTGFCKK